VVAPIIIISIKSFSSGIKTYADFFLWKPLYLKHYVNSILISGVAAFGSVTVAVLAAYVFAKKNFPGKNLLFFLYVIVMMMPFQVTLLLLVLLDDTGKYPFSILFRTITESDPDMLFTAAVMALILPALLYAIFQDELAEGLNTGKFNFTY
jgi:ABC-type glycerol-3-phosphate transport system permease component